MEYRTIVCKSAVDVGKKPISFKELSQINENNLMTQDKIRPVHIKGCIHHNGRDTTRMTKKQKFLSRNMSSMIGWVVMFSGSGKIGGIDEVQCDDFIQDIVDKQIYVENIEELENYFKFNTVEVNIKLVMPKESSFKIKITETLYNKLNSIGACIEDADLDENDPEYTMYRPDLKYKVRLADGTCGWYTVGYIMKML